MKGAEVVILFKLQNYGGIDWTTSCFQYGHSKACVVNIWGEIFPKTYAITTLHDAPKFV